MVIKQRGFVPIFILVGMLILGAIGTAFYLMQYSVRSPISTSSILQPTITEASPTAKISQSPTKTTIQKASVKTTPDSSVNISTSIVPPTTPTTQPSKNPTNTPTPQSTCDINAWAKPMEPYSYFDNPLTVTLIYSASIHSPDNAYTTGVQWDFDGNGSWDTDMSLSNGTISHTYPNSGNFTVKLQLKISDGSTTPVCSKSVNIPMGTVVKLTGTIYSDNNCNDRRDPDESGIANAPVSIYLGGSKFENFTTDNSGNYNYTRVAPPSEAISVQVSTNPAPGYNIHAPSGWTPPTFSLNSSQPSVNVDLPQVPLDKVSLCHA